MNSKIKLIFFLTYILFTSIASSQSLTGNSGLISIPTAETLPDGGIALGVNYINKKYVKYIDGKYSASDYFATVNFLPFLEVSLHVTRYLNFPQGQALGDRTASFRIKLFHENKFIPSIVIGAHDFMETEDNGTNKLLNALYIATSKHFNVKSKNNIAGIHLGYGTDWIKAYAHHFVGLFGGISFEHKKFIKGMIEYDAERFNCGAEITLFNHIKILAGLMEFNTFSGGISYKTQLF
jgi:hypothetical protein